MSSYKSAITHRLTCPTYVNPGLKKAGVNWLKNKTCDWSTKVTRTSLVTGTTKSDFFSSFFNFSSFSSSLSLVSLCRGRISSTFTETLISCPTRGSSVFMPNTCLISSGFSENSLWPATSCWSEISHSVLVQNCNIFQIIQIIIIFFK